MQNFNHRTSIQIRFKDADKMGHINNANYLTYTELARAKYFEDVLKEGGNWSRKEGIILARVEIDYKKPVLLHDSVFVYTKCTRIGTKSLDLSFLVVREKNGVKEIVAQGLTVLVCFDYVNEKTIEIPVLQKQKIMEYDGLE